MKLKNVYEDVFYDYALIVEYNCGVWCGDASKFHNLLIIKFLLL